MSGRFRIGQFAFTWRRTAIGGERGIQLVGTHKNASRFKCERLRVKQNLGQDALTYPTIFA
jgi:hypothetical protein